MRTLSSPNGKYRIQSKIGSGKSAEVYLAYSQSTQQECAIKIIPKHSVIGKEARAAVQRECSILSKISHENVIQYIDHFEDAENNYLVTEYFQGITITERVNLVGSLDSALVIKIFSQLCTIISFLHQNDVCHQNISPDNVLIDDSNTIKLIDFGAACNEVQSRTATDILIHASPPEVISGRFYVPSLVDSWQLGYFLFYVFTNDYPWHGISVNNLTIPTLEIPPAIPEKVHTLLKSLLEINPLRRYSVEQASSYYWLSRPISRIKSSITFHSVMSPFLSSPNSPKVKVFSKPNNNIAKRHSVGLLSLSDTFPGGGKGEGNDTSPLIRKNRILSSPTFQ